MIRQLRGTIAHITDTHVVLLVHGVGYTVHVGDTAGFPLESEQTLHTYLAVRETALDLYGFITLDELEIFELLLTLPKIGPKSAATIMAQTDIALLKTAVITDDPSHLSKMSGVGKKTSEKIVAGLKDTFADHNITAPVGTDADLANHHRDTIDALIALGYTPADARTAVQNLPDTITTPNEAVKAALQTLNQSL